MNKIMTLVEDTKEMEWWKDKNSMWFCETMKDQMKTLHNHIPASE